MVREMVERDVSYFWNHSCEPNCIIYNDNYTIACRDIAAGEEIVYDYGTSKPLLSLPWTCRCGTVTCRQRVSAEDWKRTDLRTKFGRHWASHCLQLIDKEKDNKKHDDATTAAAAAVVVPSKSS
jgi:hypothetical protein